MHFILLGPLEAVHHGKSVHLGGLHQRAALAYLLLHANRVVATSRLVHAIWGESAPATARKMLHNTVAGIRKLLVSHGAAQEQISLTTRVPGYLLRIHFDLVDLHRFECLVREGRAWLAHQSWDRAARALGEATALWQGPVLADLVEAGIDWPELAAVRSARLSAFEDLVDAEFALGRHHKMIDRLEAALAENPMRERICGQLMVALYHCSRQAEALMVYQRTRAALVEQVGLQPSPELRTLQQSILHHDMTLMPQSGMSVTR